jgi:hypothetical protein
MINPQAMSRESGARIEVSKDDLGDRDAARGPGTMGSHMESTGLPWVIKSLWHVFLFCDIVL